MTGYSGGSVGRAFREVWAGVEGKVKERQILVTPLPHFLLKTVVVLEKFILDIRL
jgi:hypothetical protein